MYRNLDTGLIRSFLAVADMGSMTTAAKRLNLTQGAISQQIKRLEAALQCSLFDRSRRGLKLTREGDRLVGLSRRLLEANDEIWSAMTTPAMQGEVRLGIPHDLVTVYLPTVLENFVTGNPSIDVSLVSGASPDLLAELRQGTIDVALVEEPLGATEGECLSVERLLWIGAKGGRAYRSRPLPLSMITDSCGFHEPVVDALDDDGIAWRTVFENGTIDTTLTTVRADLAVTVSLASVVPSDLDILSGGAGLPVLPSFAVNLYLNEAGANRAAAELAQQFRDAVQRRSLKSA